MIHNFRRSALGQLIAFGWKYRRRAIGLLALQLLLLATSVFILQLGGFAIDWIRFRNSMETNPPTIYGWNPLRLETSITFEVATIALLITATACLRSVINYTYAIGNGLFINKEMVVDLRIATFRKLQVLDFKYFNHNPPSSLLNRLTNDIQLARSFIDGVVIQFLVLIMSLAFYLIAMLQIHIGLTFASLATIPVMVWQTISFSRKTRSQYDRSRELSDILTRRAQENIEGQIAVKSFGRQADEIERFRQATHRIESQQRNIYWKVSTYTPWTQLMTQAGLIILLLYGGYLVITGQLALGSGLVVFAGLLQQFSNQVNAITGIANTVEQSLAGARRVFEVLDAPETMNQELLSNSQHTAEEIQTESSTKNGEGGLIEGEFKLNKVCFSYRRDEQVLRSITLDIPAYKFTAIVGQVGSGKSTLLNLLARFYDPDQGCIELDGRNLAEYNLLQLRDAIGMVFQDATVYSTSIFDNIAYGNPNASLEDVILAAKRASVHDFIESLPQGYMTKLGESGCTLSGGQRQRISLARAMLINPKVLILDDPTSAVDVQTERCILNNLRELASNQTLIVSTNRQNILDQADVVHFIQNGQIIGSGSHRELLHSCADYKSLLAFESDLMT